MSDTTGVRLLGNDKPNIGRVQVEYDDEWVDVCFNGDGNDRPWNSNTLNILCRQLGYPGSMLFRNVTIFSSSNGTSIDDYKCRGGKNCIFMKLLGISVIECQFAREVVI